MITATNPITEQVYPGWTTHHFSGERLAPGVCSVSFVAAPCYLLDPATGATQTHGDPTKRREVSLPNVFAPARTYGEWWTEELRLRLMLALAELEEVGGLIGKAQGVL